MKGEVKVCEVVICALIASPEIVREISVLTFRKIVTCAIRPVSVCSRFFLSISSKTAR